MPALARSSTSGGEEAVAVAGHQGLHHRMVRARRSAAERGPGRSAAGAAGHLMQELIGALGRAQVAAVEAEIGIDHADQGQHGEMMALGDHLGADQEIDLVLLTCRR